MTTEKMQSYEELRQLLVNAESARAAAERVLLAFPNAGHETAILLGRAWTLYEKYYEKRTGQKLTATYSNFTNLSALGDMTIDDLSKEMQALSSYNISEAGECSIAQGHLEDLCFFLDGEFRNAVKSLRSEYNVNFMTWKYRNLSIAVAACVLLAIVATCLWQTLGPKYWRISYYGNTNLSGRPTHVEEGNSTSDGTLARAKAFLQRKGAIRSDGFSMKYEGCLKLDNAEDIDWSLGSDDGSRLFVDGEEIIDNWGSHAMTTKTAKQHLASGMHRIRIEFFDNAGSASLELAIKGNNSKLIKSIRAAEEGGKCK